jgi:hypothetical protein
MPSSQHSSLRLSSLLTLLMPRMHFLRRYCQTAYRMIMFLSCRYSPILCWPVNAFFFLSLSRMREGETWKGKKSDEKESRVGTPASTIIRSLFCVFLSRSSSHASDVSTRPVLVGYKDKRKESCSTVTCFVLSVRSDRRC